MYQNNSGQIFECLHLDGHLYLNLGAFAFYLVLSPNDLNLETFGSKIQFI